MATQEVTTKNQPVEKETQQTENEIINLEIREYIRKALIGYLTDDCREEVGQFRTFLTLKNGRNSTIFV